MKQGAVFHTRDLALATCMCLSLPLLSVDATDGNRVTFAFERNEQAEETIRAFWSGDLRVEPRAFFAKVRELKARIYAES